MTMEIRCVYVNLSMLYYSFYAILHGPMEAHAQNKELRPQQNRSIGSTEKQLPRLPQEIVPAVSIASVRLVIFSFVCAKSGIASYQTKLA